MADKKPAKPAAKKAAVKTAAPSAAGKATGGAGKAKAQAGAVKKAKVSANSDSPVGLFQYFLPKQSADLADPGMRPLKAPDRVSPITLPNFVKELLTHASTQGLTHWGLLPADFPTRLGMDAGQIRAAIDAAPGFDVYTLNPHIELEAVYQNLWIQGEISHPQLLTLSSEVFKHVGLNPGVLTRMVHSDRIVTGHAVIAKPAFWEGWLSFVAGFLKKTETLPDAVKVMLYQGNADPKGIHPNGTFLMFVLERLLGEFILANENRFSVHRLRSPAQEKMLNRYLRDMRTLRDLSVRAGSAELAGIWSGYRKLYLTGSQGKEWMDQHGKLLDQLQLESVKAKA